MLYDLVGVTVALDLIGIIAALRIKRRLRADGRPERRFAFRARRFMIVFESTMVFLLILVNLGVGFGVTRGVLALFTTLIAIAATVVPPFMMILIPGLIGPPR